MLPTLRPPTDDSMAIAELERLRDLGAAYAVLGWPAFWWRETFAQFFRHLRDRYVCTFENEQMVVFDLAAPRPVSG